MIFGVGKNFQTEWGLDNEAQVFFILRWQELFDDKTYDSWQVRTSNVQTMMDEALVGLNMARLEPKSYIALETLLDEALSVAGRDPVIREFMPSVRHMLSELNKVYGANKNTNTRDLASLESRVRVIKGALRHYHSTLRKMLGGALLNPDQNFKKQLYVLASTYAVWLVSQGYSLAFIRSSWQSLIDTGFGDFKKRWSRFISGFRGHHREFVCIFPLRASMGDLPDGTFDDVRFKTASDLLNQYSKPICRDWVKRHRPNVFAEVTCCSVDQMAARHVGRMKVEECLAAVRLFHFQGSFDIHGTEALVYQDKTESAAIMDHDTTVLEYMRTPRNAHDRVNALSKVVSRLPDTDASRLGAVMEYHRLALSAKMDEARLVNLWVALECLVRQPGKSIIANVTDYLPFTIATHHMQGVMRSLAIDLREVWRTPAAKPLKDACQSTGPLKRHLPLPDLAFWLGQDDAEPEIQCLYHAIATNNPLMVFRLYGVQKRYFSDRKTLERSLTQHATHLDWQLRRIYRARNMIIHLGQHPAAVQQLVQHLHSYLILTVLNLLQDLRNNETWTIMDALGFRKRIFDIWVNSSAELFPECFLNPALLAIPLRTAFHKPIFSQNTGRQ